MIKRSIHTLYDVSKINSFIYRKRIFCVITMILALFIDSKTSKYLMRFLHYAFFVAKSHVSVLFSWPLYFCRIECNLLWIIIQ